MWHGQPGVLCLRQYGADAAPVLDYVACSFINHSAESA